MDEPNDRERELALELDRAIVEAETGAPLSVVMVRVQALIAAKLAAYRFELARTGQPPRATEDGAVWMKPVGDYLAIGCTQNEKPTALLASQYNAHRIFGMLAMMLGIELPPGVARGIRLLEPNGGLLHAEAISEDDRHG